MKRLSSVISDSGRNPDMVSAKWPGTAVRAWGIAQRTALGFLLSLCACGAVAETEFWSVVGSFNTLERAENARRSANTALTQQFDVRGADTARDYLYRVVAGPYLTRELAEDAVAEARRNGFADAWLLATQTSLSDPTVSPAVSSAAAAAQPDSTLGPANSYQGVQPQTESPAIRQRSPRPGRPAGESRDTGTGEDLPELISEPPANYNLHKLRRDAQARPPPDGGAVATPADFVFILPADLPVNPPRIDPATDPIKTDGKLNEAIWSSAPVQDDFSVLEPDTLAKPRYKTRLLMLYSPRGLYVGVDMEQPHDDLVRWLSGRDEGRLRRDNVALTLDTSGDGRYGYWMSLALGDNVTDGTILPERRYSVDWDGAWNGGTALTEKGWSAEFFIPWSQMAMPKESGRRRIGFYFSRLYANGNERWGLPQLPPTQSKFMSSLRSIWLDDVNPRQQWSVFPYAAMTVDEVASETRYKAGAELFWRPSTNFQATASINPDFGNVEADDVVVNLTAFEVFFPERRLFFLEGQEIFNVSPRSDAGNSDPVTVVNTRRIGGRPRPPRLPPGSTAVIPAAQLTQPAELLGAAKVTGQVGSLRYGVLGAFEDETRFSAGGTRLTQDGSDYSALRMVHERSVRGDFRGLGMIASHVGHPERKASVAGLDGHYLSPNGAWKIDTAAFVSDIDDERFTAGNGTGYGGLFDAVYTPRQGLNFSLGLSAYDDKFQMNDLGFLRRNDAVNVRLGAQWQGASNGWWRDYEVSPFVQQEWNSDGDMTRSGFGTVFELTRPNLDLVFGKLAFFPKRFDDRNSFGNGTFRIQERPSLEFGYETNQARALSVFAVAEYEGEQQGGHYTFFETGFTWRPISNFNLKLSAAYRDRDGWLLHQEDRNFTTFQAEERRIELKSDYFLTARQQLRVALQWVGIRAEEDEFYQVPLRTGSLQQVARPAGPSDDFAISRLNFQVRYRWQIAPLSDLFVVYTRDGLGNDRDANFQALFDDVWDEPVGDQLVVKLRYRLGS
ncbi:MAG: DUF5916 domain-containing protein [Pseudomonadales bacterium]